ncbi:YvcK family protein [Candidatus Berkelbacteria bacterium]|nr:YvcK family protein [Candidatus Berkelbacteria bacterium]
MKHPRIVAIGGGTGLYNLLRGLRQYPADLTSIVAMTDDGGSTGKLRTEFGVLPPGDIRRSIVALSESPDRMFELFQYRFQRGGVAGHSFGNLFITALREITGSDEQAIDEAAELLRVHGTVLPVTLDDRQLVAELDDGQTVTGQSRIDLSHYEQSRRIVALRLNQPATANPRALAALQATDFIVLGPGDLFGSLIANLIVPGIASAIAKSRARLLFVCNLMTKRGETSGFTVIQYVLTLHQYLAGRIIDSVLYSQLKPRKTVRAAYAAEGAAPVRATLGLNSNLKPRYHRIPMATRGDLLHHDPTKLARAIWSIVQSS